MLKTYLYIPDELEDSLKETLTSGKAISSFELQTSIYKLIETGNYRDVKIQITEGQNSTELNFLIEENPQVKDVEISGVTLLETHCVCSDSTSISLYTTSESCNEIIPDHSCCESENTCNEYFVSHNKHHSCGCNEPIVTYLKLTNHVGEGSYLEYPKSQQLYLVHFPEAESFRIIISLIIYLRKTHSMAGFLSLL